ncbi:MAG: CPBP family intramembrane metalloprotease [Planctomycetes bacterium]|nr:CPBP family intramembrane metalloprotease [Planctomycetota bacterium]
MGTKRSARGPKHSLGWLDAYLDDSRDLAVGALLAFPILLAYEIGIFLTRSRYQNAVEYVVKAPFRRFFGPDAFLITNGLVILGAAYLLGRLGRTRRLRWELAAGVVLEALLYALLLGRVVGLTLRKVGLAAAAGGPSEGLTIVLALGAGVYEEVFFRLGLLGTLEWLFAKAAGLPRTWAGALAVVAGSLVFSAAHYWGISPSATFEASGFAFRFLAGVALSTIFLLRGLAVAVYTHAIYDCLLVLLP